MDGESTLNATKIHLKKERVMGVLSFDDQKVQSYVNKALAANSHRKSFEERLLGAFGDLYAQRGREDPNDDNLELAAAEHYMYARYQVYSGETQATVMQAVTFGYDAMKLLAYLPLFYVIRKFIVRHSWTRPSTDIIRWGLRGCQDGEANRRIIPEGSES